VKRQNKYDTKKESENSGDETVYETEDGDTIETFESEKVSTLKKECYENEEKGETLESEKVSTLKKELDENEEK
jgi:predicted lipid-binding transport protein (Tim44 family)